MISKPFTTIDEQIKILKRRNLQFKDETSAKNLLKRYGYYEIINGYKDCFLEENTNSNKEERFKDGTTFENIHALYIFDKEIQSAIRDLTLEFEIILKSATSYVLGNLYTSNEKLYLNRNNFKAGKKKIKNGLTIYEIDEVIFKFSKILEDNIQPFKHFKDNHGHIPPWILFKGATFGNMISLYKLQKTYAKNAIIAIILDIPETVVSNVQEIKDFFSDALSLIHKFRNRASHSGRIFNYRPDRVRMRYNPLYHPNINISSEDYRKGFGQNDLFTLISVVKNFKNSVMSNRILLILNYYLNRHLQLYPNDRDFILASIGVPPSLRDKDIDKIF